MLSLLKLQSTRKQSSIFKELKLTWLKKYKTKKKMKKMAKKRKKEMKANRFFTVIKDIKWLLREITI